MDLNRIERSRKFSHIGMHSKSTISYAIQYKRAFDILYESGGQSIDSIVLPTMFLMRHYLELILKYNIQYFSKFSESKNMVSKLDESHKLEALANAFQEHWNIVVKKYKVKIDDKEYIKNFKVLIEIIAELDNFSMSFRYSHDKDKTNHFNWDRTIDVYNIKELLDKVLPMLNHSTDVFYEQIGQYIEQEKDMMKESEQEIISNMYYS